MLYAAQVDALVILEVIDNNVHARLQRRSAEGQAATSPSGRRSSRHIGRDQRVNGALAVDEWLVRRVWEHEALALIAAEIELTLRSRSARRRTQPGGPAVGP